MLVCTQQLQQACLLASKLLNIFLVCSRCRARCAYGGLCAFYIPFLFPSSHQNAVCKSHYPICAASLDKTAQDKSSSFLHSGTIWELRMMAMMEGCRGLVLSPSNAEATCKPSRSLLRGGNRSFASKISSRRLKKE